MPKSGARLPKSEATRLRLLDCAAAEVLESGPDHVGFTAIARRAQMSTGALYARYENVDELLLELWMFKGLPTLRTLAADMEESLTGDAARAARRRVADALSEPDSDLALLVSLLMVARRNEALGEFVVPSTESVLENAMRVAPAFDFYLGQVLGIAMGVRGAAMSGLDWYSPVSIVASATRDATPPVVIDPSSPAIAETSSGGPDIDEMDARLFQAVSKVIARVGVDKATISRIARHADVNPASIYLRYEDKNALFSACIAHVMASTYGQNERLITYYNHGVDQQKGMGGERYGVVMFRGNQSEEHAQTRRLRLETMFAAAHHDHLCAITKKVFAEILSDEERQLGVPEGLIVQSSHLPLILFSRFAFFGYALLREFGYLSPEHPHLVPFTEQVGDRLFASASWLRAGPRQN